MTLAILDDDGTPAATEEFYTYDQMGNMLSKTGVGTCTNGANGVGNATTMCGIRKSSSSI